MPVLRYKGSVCSLVVAELGFEKWNPKQVRTVSAAHAGKLLELHGQHFEVLPEEPAAAPAPAPAAEAEEPAQEKAQPKTKDKALGKQKDKQEQAEPAKDEG